MNFVDDRMRPICTRCEGDDRDGAMRSSGDSMICVACWEMRLATCDDCGEEVPELSLVAVNDERHCKECASFDGSFENDSTIREGFEE